MPDPDRKSPPITLSALWPDLALVAFLIAFCVGGAASAARLGLPADRGERPVRRARSAPSGAGHRRAGRWPCRFPRGYAARPRRLAHGAGRLSRRLRSQPLPASTFPWQARCCRHCGGDAALFAGVLRAVEWRGLGLQRHVQLELAGLTESTSPALPFLAVHRRSAIMFGPRVLFGGYWLATQHVPALQRR